MKAQRIIAVSLGVSILGGRYAFGGSLGIPLDSFLLQFTTFVTGTGLLIGLIGATGWALAHLGHTQNTFLQGSVNLFGTAGILGGATTIMGALGLVSGAVLPL